MHDHLEFVPVEAWTAGRADTERRLVGDLDPGRDYVLLVTNGAGAFSYVVGDVVQCASAGERPRLRLGRRLGLILDLAGEKTSARAVQRAVEDISREVGASAGEYLVTGVQPADGPPRYLWLLERCEVWRRIEDLPGTLDAWLGRSNGSYASMRAEGLGRPEVRILEPGSLERWAAEHGNGSGQHKVPHVVEDPETLGDLVGEPERHGGGG